MLAIARYAAEHFSATDAKHASSLPATFWIKHEIK